MQNLLFCQNKYLNNTMHKRSRNDQENNPFTSRLRSKDSKKNFSKVFLIIVLISFSEKPYKRQPHLC